MRKKGWYRIFRKNGDVELAFFNGEEHPWFSVIDSEVGIDDSLISSVDEEMVMTEGGEMVYQGTRK